MPVLVTSNFDDDSIKNERASKETAFSHYKSMGNFLDAHFDDDTIKNERASMETPFSHYKSMGNFLDAQGQLTPSSVARSGQDSNSTETLCMSSLPASIRGSDQKQPRKG